MGQKAGMVKYKTMFLNFFFLTIIEEIFFVHFFMKVGGGGVRNTFLGKYHIK